MNTSIEILKRDTLPEGGFAGLKEHCLIKEPTLFGPQENNDGSWPGKINVNGKALGNFVYLADARFMPHGETRMHGHHEIDVISVMVDGNISHEGSLEHGKDLTANDVQVQRAGGEGFQHNEINPDDNWNRMLQLWVSPEKPGQPADYKVYTPTPGVMTRIYGGDASNDFPAQTHIDVAMLSKGQEVSIDKSFLAYLSRGHGIANNAKVEDGDLMRGESLQFTAQSDTQLVIVHV